MEGNDVIIAGGGSDTVYGGDGDDIIFASESWMDQYRAEVTDPRRIGE